ncbi:DUF1761 domain-containing protein [Flavobacterium sp.]|jgi:sterol desaturase/sphingolipid hydroxylase (fatty acid hydroxylase superfamily)|uniref:DUF1761 domain-containing protein n=1 Tax=Flavobacterium sp. TaxID=239 RepID=UPI00286ED921|nr:DUF1761 domain-containing protein [Flavobacterium sp.]
MEMNFISPVVAAFTTLLVGFVWYHPKVFGTAWMKETGLTQEELAKGNMLKIFGLTFIFSIFISFIMQMLAIHQMGALSMIGGAAKVAEAKPSFAAFMSDYGAAFRTAKHGAFHGLFTAVLFAFPMIAINGLFERKSWKYIFIHAGYWVISLMIIGAIVCAWI